MSSFPDENALALAVCWGEMSSLFNLQSSQADLHIHESLTSFTTKMLQQKKERKHPSLHHSVFLFF